MPHATGETGYTSKEKVAVSLKKATTRVTKKIKGERMNTKDKVFLARADAVTENYQKRIAKLQDRLAQVEADIILDTGGWKRVRKGLDTLNKLEKLQAEQQQHTQRVRELREQQYQTQALNKLCADATKLAGTDGANFWTKAGNAFKEKTHR